MSKSDPPVKRAAAPAAAGGKKAVFVRRATSTIGLWVLIGVAVAFESVPVLSGFVVAVGTLACARFLGLLGLRGTPGWGGVSKVAIICAFGHLVAVGFAQASPEGTFLLPLLIIGVSIGLLFQKIDPPATRRMFLGAVFGFAYTAVLTGFMIGILRAPSLDPMETVPASAGIYYLLFVLASTKFTDMGAYIVGTAIGKRKFIPHISPGKTWEGIVGGGFPFALLGGALIYHFFGDQMPALSWPSALGMSALLAAVAIVGDLAESVIKRCLEKKDSGAVLPGIGGVLDLVDSVLFTAPVFYYYLLIVT